MGVARHSRQLACPPPQQRRLGRGRIKGGQVEGSLVARVAWALARVATGQQRAHSQVIEPWPERAIDHMSWLPGHATSPNSSSSLLGATCHCHRQRFIRMHRATCRPIIRELDRNHLAWFALIRDDSSSSPKSENIETKTMENVTFHIN